MLLKVSLLGFESGDLGLYFIIFIFLAEIGFFHVLFGFENIVGQVLSNLLGLSRKGIIESLFLGSEGLDLLFVEVELFLEGLNGFFETVDLSLEGCSKRTGGHGVVRLRHISE